MPCKYKVSLNEEDFSNKSASSGGATFYPLELYVIETKSDIFLEYAFNSTLYSLEDIKHIHYLFEETINSIYSYETFN